MNNANKSRRKPVVHFSLNAWAYNGPSHTSACGKSGIVGETVVFQIEAATCQKCIDMYVMRQARLREMAEERKAG